MKRVVIYFLSMLAVLSCSTGKRAFEKGDYDKAVLQATDRLRNDTDNEKAIAVLPEAYKLSIRVHKDKLQKLINSADPYKWENISREYQQLNQLANEIQRCPACLKLVKPSFFHKEELEARTNASNYRFSVASQKMAANNSREEAISAYQDLEVANRLTPNSPKIQELMQEALHLGTLYVVVQPLVPQNDFRFGYMDVLNQRLVDYLHNTNINRFVRFYSPQEAQRAQLQWIDHEITLGVNYFMPSKNTHTESYTLSKDSVLLDGRSGQKPKYGTVSAHITEQTVEYDCKAQMVIVIEDAENNIPIRNEVLSNGFIWTDKRASFRGDERALDDVAKDLINAKPRQQPTPDFLFQATTDPLYDQATRFLRNFYRNY